MLRLDPNGIQETTEEWWETRRRNCELFISEGVLDEVSDGDPSVAAKRLALLEGLPRLGVITAADALVARLLEEQIIPAVAAPDAVHVALAAVHGMDFLLTWNCKHIHNPALERRIQTACRACGFACPVICSPAELLEA
jgi:hypothetical protein